MKASSTINFNLSPIILNKCVCGETDHQSRKSSKCLLNSKKTTTNVSLNAQPNLVSQPSIYSCQQQSFKTILLDLPRCCCGASDHKTIRSLKCPLNPKNKHTTNQSHEESNAQPELISNQQPTLISKEQYLKEFDEKKNGPLHEQKWVNQEINEFFFFFKGI
ncbi:unnamed protein product [Brachionus calyciflorus]|uniref:Uncharacterized protein n=1 Tax=Brachionus calyciflorus TaxID=104777 RepID=A0A813YP61_9BILA|nr:unnamed protein product [Brachionus calyciflorus]